MSIQTKKGFTLIELMVVIVIIGILAAIAIPKLFGMSAKAKAQEVGPAAGTWAKLQQAYKMEKGSYGGPLAIGYKIPGNLTTGATVAKNATDNFEYEIKGADSLTWEGKSKFSSDPCPTGKIWSAIFTATQTTEDPTVDIDFAGCITLTPSWCNIGVKGSTACGGAAPSGGP